MAIKSYTDASRSNYGRSDQVSNAFSNGDLQVGCLQRIADACETMAKDRVALEDELQTIKESYRQQRAAFLSAQKSIRVLKGHITRLKNKAAISIGPDNVSFKINHL